MLLRRSSTKLRHLNKRSLRMMLRLQNNWIHQRKESWVKKRRLKKRNLHRLMKKFKKCLLRMRLRKKQLLPKRQGFLLSLLPKMKGEGLLKRHKKSSMLKKLWKQRQLNWKHKLQHWKKRRRIHSKQNRQDPNPKQKRRLRKLTQVRKSQISLHLLKGTAAMKVGLQICPIP